VWETWPLRVAFAKTSGFSEGDKPQETCPLGRRGNVPSDQNSRRAGVMPRGRDTRCKPLANNELHDKPIGLPVCRPGGPWLGRAVPTGYITESRRSTESRGTERSASSTRTAAQTTEIYHARRAKSAAKAPESPMLARGVVSSHQHLPNSVLPSRPTSDQTEYCFAS
jgi:hypothetical protein